MRKLRVALAQLNLTVGDLIGNRLRIADSILSAKAWRADLVVVPEMALTGYPPEDLLLRPQFVKDNLNELSYLSGLTEGIVALVGFVDRSPSGGIYNAAAILAHGKRLAAYHKQNLPNYGVFDERRYFSAGNNPLALDLGGVCIGVTICEDLWEEEPCKRLSGNGCQLVVNLSASPYHAGKLKERERLFARRARENRLAVAYCNLVGAQDELVFDGASLILDPLGRQCAKGLQFSEDLVVADLEVSKKGSSISCRADVVRVECASSERPPILARQSSSLAPIEEIYEALKLGVSDYARKNGFKRVVLGLSGGIDSSLTACVAVDSLGSDNVTGLVMPSRFSARETQADARRLAASLGIQCKEMPIDALVRSYIKALAAVVPQGLAGRANFSLGIMEQNIQARIRGNLLMALSNAFGWLVLTTGNKSEMATGYTTLYGDMAGGLAVIKDVPKSLVYRLARYRNRKEKTAPIPAAVFTRAPSAELAPHQKDRDSLPPYSALDRILEAYVEADRNFQEIVAHGNAQPALVRKVIRMVDRAEYKRRQGPPGIKITPKAFGRDRRMPITNRYQQG